ncbi:MAG: DUF3945 domain-containing protein [Prevotellaceae bacterium]|jgi:hypothetical protein|nr:DUF3945 domain-containing protein [Prevotellaceae bacterium]
MEQENKNTKNTQVIENSEKKEQNLTQKVMPKKTIAETVLGITIDERDGIIDNAYRNFMEQYKREPKIPKDKFKELWADFEKLGITMMKLQNADALPQLIDGKITNKVIPITTEVAGGKIETEGKIALHKNKNEDVTLKLYPMKKELNLKEYFGHVFTDEERENILKTGSPGKVIFAEFKKEEGKVPVLLTLDKEINHFFAQRQEYIKIPEKFFKATLSEEQKQDLLNGKIVKIEGMESNLKPGVTFSTNVQYSARRRGLELLFEQNQEKKLFPPKKIANMELSQEQRDTLQNGKAIFAKSLTDKKGNKYDAYIKWNPEDGKLKFSSKNPNNDTVKTETFKTVHNVPRTQQAAKQKQVAKQTQEKAAKVAPTKKNTGIKI